MLRSRLSLLWLVPALMLLMAFRQVPLQDPAPLAVPAKLTMVQVAKDLATKGEIMLAGAGGDDELIY